MSLYYAIVFFFIKSLTKKRIMEREGERGAKASLINCQICQMMNQLIRFCKLAEVNSTR